MKEITDKMRMDWLEDQSVKVSTVLRYGFRELFAVAPDNDDDAPSDIRRIIDEHIRKGH